MPAHLLGLLGVERSGATDDRTQDTYLAHIVEQSGESDACRPLGRQTEHQGRLLGVGGDAL